jgi:uncharacterized protein (UPF0332 family)
MSLKNLLNKGILKKHQTSQKEIYDLFGIVDRDLEDAAVPNLSTDRRFAIIYNATLQAVTALLHCEGYRISGHGHHANTFLFLRHYNKGKFKDESAYFDQCRSKRNLTDYDYAGSISDTECKELLKEAEKFIEEVKQILTKKHKKF